MSMLVDIISYLHQAHLSLILVSSCFTVPYADVPSECLRVAGMQKGFVLDSQVTASSQLVLSPAGRARLNFTYGMRHRLATL